MDQLTAFLHEDFADRLADASGGCEPRLLLGSALLIGEDVFIFHSELIGILYFCLLGLPGIREKGRKVHADQTSTEPTTNKNTATGDKKFGFYST